MQPVICRVKHDPPHSYGDCIRACVASILELDAEDVPHFAHDNPDGTVAFVRLRDWLKTVGYAPFVVGFPGAVPMDQLLSDMQDHQPDIVYMLFGGVHGGGDHVVVCRGGEVIHNPAWIGCSIVGPTSQDQWQIVVLVKL
jgi:hypothetical protein